MSTKTKWIWLSHVTSSHTPAYGGGHAFQAVPDKQIAQGDSCNTKALRLSNHIGSHVDAPRHFVDDGRTVEDYTPEEWIFCQPLLLDVNVEKSAIIDVHHLDKAIPTHVSDADMVLVRTGMEKDRSEDAFWKTPPGFAPETCLYLSQRFPSFSVIGMDTISISSFAQREIGRMAHRAFLECGIRIFEDLALSSVHDAAVLRRVIALPFRFSDADGAPVTLMGELTQNLSCGRVDICG
ncbi:MAG: cyclase family protein [Magnetococcales bacterium]|nr:cyclase family protein [Magnetococcales bacterium]